MSNFNFGAKSWPGLAKLIEEAAEVIQVGSKIVMLQETKPGQTEHWDGTELVTRLEDEIGDVLAAIDFVKDQCTLSTDLIEARRKAKLKQFYIWHIEKDMENSVMEALRKG